MTLTSGLAGQQQARMGTAGSASPGAAAAAGWLLRSGSEVPLCLFNMLLAFRGMEAGE